MMWIPEYLRKNVTETNNDQTLYIDLPKNEQISFLQIELSATGIGARTTTLFIDEIDTIEVLADGSKVIGSLEPELWLYQHFLTHDGIFAPAVCTNIPGVRDTIEFNLNFGRYDFDEEYLLDTSLYNNVQLRIKYTLDVALYTTQTFRSNIVMWRPLTKLSPKGFIRNRVINKETLAAAAQVIYHDLPMTYPLRYLATRFEDLDQNIATDCTAIKLNIDEGRLILRDQNINEILDEDKRRFPVKSYYKLLHAISDATMVRGFVDNPYPRAIVSSGVLPMVWKIYWAIGEQVGLNLYDMAGAVLGGSYAMDLYVSGSNPHKCMTLYDGRNEPLDVSKFSQGKIEYTMAAYVTILHTYVQEIVQGVLS
jgi:hypothetical protein